MSYCHRVQLNSVAICAGNTKYCKGTSFYDYSPEKDLLNQARRLTWRDNYEASELIQKIPFTARLDNTFYKKAFFAKPIFFELYISRVPKFFLSV